MDDPARRVWDTALGQLQLQVTRPNFDTWLKETVGLAAENGTFVVGTPSDFVSEWLRAKMGPVIASTVSGIIGHPVSVGFRVVAPTNGDNGSHADPPPLPAPDPTPTVTPSPARPKMLNSRFTFERFVVGETNRMAADAAQTAADQPGAGYNPLYIYGGPGLGKTHLLQAIAHRAASANRRVVYVTSEQFTNEFVASISQGTQDEFRRRYRSADVLLVDDIQFLCGKDRTQEEFFHTFNDLYLSDRQLVLTSDRMPKTCDGLHARLRSRFESGLSTDVRPPDDDTRLAILRRKAEERQVDIPPDSARIIADRAHDNIRELEGLLNRVVAYAKLTRAPIDEELIDHALHALSPTKPSSPPAPEAIIQAVAAQFNTSRQALAGPSRAKPIADARHVAMYLLREDGQLPLKAIGRLLGNRDHSTVIHGCRKASASLNTPHGRSHLREIRSHITR